MQVIEHIRAFAAAQPQHPALILSSDDGPDGSLSYAELMAHVDAQADSLRLAGLQAGDRCGIRAKGGPRFIETALAVLSADACMVPIPHDTSGAALDAFTQQARLHALIDEDGGFELQSFSAVEDVDGQGDRAFRSLSPAYLRYTSGTTHERKGVILGAGSIDARLTAANRALGISPEDRILWLLPMAHHFVVSILLYLRHGATVLLPSGPLARPILAFGERARATVLYASPHHYSQLAGDTSECKLGNVRLAISTATGLRESVAEAFRKRFGFPVVQALGIIEVGLPVINEPSAVTKPTALGRPLPDYDVRLIDEHGRSVPTGESGELCIRGPGLFDAYLDPWTPAEQLTAEFGFRTGDQGRFDAEGDLRLEGRRANRISMAGMKFFAEEVEHVIDAHPAVRESRVRALDHEQLGEIPIAEVVPVDPEKAPEKRELVRFCRDHLPTYKIPRRFEIVADLPRTETGKIRRWDSSPE